jgi:hypothetical protein
MHLQLQQAAHKQGTPAKVDVPCTTATDELHTAGDATKMIRQRSAYDASAQVQAHAV